MGKGGVNGISLVKVIWKLLTSIMKNWPSCLIALYNFLQIFQEGQEMRTAIVEENITRQIELINITLMLHIFLDLQKSYDVLDRRGACRY